VARFSTPQGLTADAAGNIYVADTGNNTVRKITPAGLVTTLPEPAGSNNATNNPPLKSPGGVAVDRAGNIYVANTSDHCVMKISAAGGP
jgi:DNA-binding beta-propeller fold protein YncE